MCGIKQNSLQHWSSKVIGFDWNLHPQSCLQRCQQEESSILELHELFLCNVHWAGTKTWIRSFHISDLPHHLAYEQSRCSWWGRVNEKKVYFLHREERVRRRHSFLTLRPTAPSMKFAAYTNLALAVTSP